MNSFEIKRAEMVQSQLMARGIHNDYILEAMGKVPREKFFPLDLIEYAYEDNAFPLSEGQTISQPYIVALMTELLELNGNETVLEIGTGSGYQVAILAELVKKVYTIERIPLLAEKAKETLNELGYSNVEVIIKDGIEGLPEKAPFDAIIVTAAATKLPKILVSQLSDDLGKLVIPIGERFFQKLVRVTRMGEQYTIDESIPVAFVPLIGG